MRTVTALTTLVTTAAAHGIVTSPQARVLGDAFKAACGEQVSNNAKGDQYGNVQQLQQIGTSQKDFNASACDLSLCKGLQFADNSANVQAFTAGQVIAMKVDIRAPHTGVANVSVVNLQTNTIIGEPMMDWDVYASTSSGVPKNNTEFNITMPDVASDCGAAGACAVQWWWDSPSSQQTYMSCVDFTM